MLDAAHRLALRIDARRLALVVGALIAGLAVMGILRYGNKEQLGAFNLDGERNVPAVFSAALWTAVSGLAVLVGRADRWHAWHAFAVVTLVVAADEFGEIHGRLENKTVDRLAGPVPTGRNPGGDPLRGDRPAGLGRQRGSSGDDSSAAHRPRIPRCAA